MKNVEFFASRYYL